MYFQIIYYVLCSLLCNLIIAKTDYFFMSIQPDWWWCLWSAVLFICRLDQIRLLITIKPYIKLKKYIWVKINNFYYIILFPYKIFFMSCLFRSYFVLRKIVCFYMVASVYACSADICLIIVSNCDQYIVLKTWYRTHSYYN